MIDSGREKQGIRLWRSLIRDIRFWIILFFLIRLYGITLPPLETAHSWRQTTVTMTARNFYETDANILYPRIDIAGEKSGITGMEFPLLNYLIYLVSRLFGYDHWYGRILNLLISSLGTWFFYRLLCRIFTSQMAFNSTMVLLGSIWFAYSRKIMPDTFSASLMIIGLYYAQCYFLEQYRSRYILLFMFFSCLAVLAKLPTGFAMVFTAFWVFNPALPGQKRLITLFAAVVAMIPAYWWYWIHVPYLVQTFGFWHFFMGKDIGTGLSELLAWPVSTLRHFYEDAMKFSGFFLELLGLIFAILRKNYRIVVLFLAGLTAFSGVMVKAGFNFVHHSYYIIPFVPLMAMLAGYGLSEIRRQWLSVFLLLFCVSEGILNQQHDFRIKPHYAEIENLERELDSCTRRTDLFLINSGDVPTPMYFAHRKGWVASGDQIASPEFIDSLQSKGLSHILILNKAFGSPVTLPYPVLFQKEDFTLYKIHQAGQNVNY